MMEERLSIRKFVVLVPWRRGARRTITCRDDVVK